MAKILLFGVSTQKDRAVRVAAEKIGVDVTAVKRRDYGQKIGTLAEISGFHKNGKIYNGPDFAMEMLVFSGMDSQQVDAFLAEYKLIPIPDSTMAPARSNAISRFLSFLPLLPNIPIPPLRMCCKRLHL